MLRLMPRTREYDALRSSAVPVSGAIRLPVGGTIRRAIGPGRQLL
jgi:hypothetical protein